MAPNDKDDDQLSSNDTFLIENVSTECCSSTFASSTSTVMVHDGTSDDDMTGSDGEKESAAAYFTHSGNSEDGSYESGESGESYPTEQPNGKRCNCSHIQLILGIFSLMLGMITVHFDLYEFLLDERMRMTPGLPPYEWWLAPKPVITMRIFIFTAENADDFLSGVDDKLRLKEFGPIVYQEHLVHENVTIYEENSTLSYTPNRWLEFLPDRNVDDILNQTIIVPNFVLLAAASSLNNDYIIKKMAFNGFVRSAKESLFRNMTVYDYLWNYTSPSLENIRSLFPFMVPTDNNGVLYQMYKGLDDRYNVRIGPKYKDAEFFNMVTINGAPTVPRYDVARGDCDASIVNASEGALYNSRLTHDSVLWYWRKALCRAAPLHYTEEVQKGALSAYRYELRENVYDRFNDSSKDCYKGFFQPLPDGLTDVSKCYYDIPLAASHPHFYGRQPQKLADRIEGLHPNKQDHGSYIIVEPTTGVPIDQCARSQSNVVTPKFRGFLNEVQLFSEMVVPIFWVEYHLKELTSEITAMLIFTVHVAPILSNILPGIFLLAGLIFVVLGVNRFMGARNSYIGVRSKARSVSQKRRSRSINAGIIFSNPTLLTNEKELTESLFP